MADLRIRVDDLALDANWTGENPETRDALRSELPLAGDANRWGDELYFRTPVDAPAEDGRIEVATGAIAYWPQGNALCLFWGPTPASEDGEPRAASAVNVVAELTDPDALDDVAGGAHVRVEEA